MKENQTTKYRIQIDSDLLAYLNPESGEKCTKMAAFRNLVEIANGNKKEFPAIAKPLPEGQVALTVSGLAKHWNWHRTTVRKFSPLRNRWRCLHTSSPKRINYLFQNRQTNAPDDKHPPVNACTS